MDKLLIVFADRMRRGQFLSAFSLVASSCLMPGGDVHVFTTGKRLWLADILYRESKSDQLLLESFEKYPLPQQVKNSISRLAGGKKAFLISVFGSEFYLDMISCQMTTHSGLPIAGASVLPPEIAKLARVIGVSVSLTSRGWKTDDWLEHDRDTAYASIRGSQASKEAAFSYGYLLHAVMDVWAHTDINPLLKTYLLLLRISRLMIVMLVSGIVLKGVMSFFPCVGLLGWEYLINNFWLAENTVLLDIDDC